MQRAARTSVTAIAGGAGAFGFAVLPSRRVGFGLAKRLRRRRSHKSVAPANSTASIRRVAFATFTAWAASLCSTACATCVHRRLTTRSSGPRSAAAYLGR